jgi:hypothetical protein
MGKPSRDKGKTGEREAAAVWSALFGVPMRRSQQYCGRSDESDDIVGQPGVSIEVKRRERLNLGAAVSRAVEDAADGNVAVVLHRSNHQPWLVTLRLNDLPELVVRLFHTLANKSL